MTELVADAHTILAAVDGADLDGEQTEAVGLLALAGHRPAPTGDRGPTETDRRTARRGTRVDGARPG